MAAEPVDVIAPEVCTPTPSLVPPPVPVTLILPPAELIAEFAPVTRTPKLLLPALPPVPATVIAALPVELIEPPPSRRTPSSKPVPFVPVPVTVRFPFTEVIFELDPVT